MPEGVEKPPHLHIDAELLAAIGLAVLNLAHEQFTSRFHVVRHHIHPADNFQPSFSNKLAECGFLLRITLKKRLDVSDLVERKFVIPIRLQESQRLQNVRQSHLQIAFSGLEHSPLPMRVRNEIECL